MKSQSAVTETPWFWSCRHIREIEINRGPFYQVVEVVGMRLQLVI